MWVGPAFGCQGWVKDGQSVARHHDRSSVLLLIGPPFPVHYGNQRYVWTEQQWLPQESSMEFLMSNCLEALAAP